MCILYQSNRFNKVNEKKITISVKSKAKEKQFLALFDVASLNFAELSRSPIIKCVRKLYAK